MKRTLPTLNGFACPLISSLLVIWSFSATLAVAESTVRGGDGFAESQLILSILKFPKLIDLCLNTPANVVNCHFNAEINSALRKCQSDSQSLIARVNDVLFVTEQEHPEWFPPNERKEFYFNSENKKIYFNRDLIYRSGANGLKYPLQFIEIVPITVKAVSSLAGCLMNIDIEKVGRDVASAAYTSARTVEFGNAVDELRIYDPKNKVRLLHFGSDSNDSQMFWGSLYLQDSSSMFIMDQEVEKAVNCPGSKIGRYAVSRLQNKLFEKSNEGAHLVAQFNLAFSCESDMTTFDKGVFQIEASFKNKIVSNPRNENDIALQLVEKSIKIASVAE